MFEITDDAVTQINLSRKQLGEENLRLRISARYSPEYGIAYKMGFDDAYETDVKLEINGVKVAFDRDSEKMIKGMTIDYRELDGQMQIVFENPNDVSPEEVDPDAPSET
jgi:iron-sulfur cluster assembly accessory protein